MQNFGVNYCYQFMMMLQGRIPVRVRLFLIVDRKYTDTTQNTQIYRRRDVSLTDHQSINHNNSPRLV